MAYINTKRIERILKLDKTVITEIKDDKNVMQEAVVTMLAAAVIGGIWNIIGSFGLGLFVILIGTPVAWVIGTGICQLIAKALGGKGSFNDYLKLSAYTQAPAFLGIVPIIGSLVGAIISLVMFVWATKDVHNLTTGKAILVVLIPLVIAIVLVMVLGILFFTLGIFSSNTMGSGY